MDRQQLKQKLSYKYTPENWKVILKYIFPNVALFQIPQDIPVTNEKVKSFRQLGNVRLNDGKSLAVFDIQLKDNVDITRNRVELRNLTTKYIDQEETHGVLAVFASASEDYRFTFTAQETEFDENMQLVTKQTEPKRYTYVLGPNESCQTASDRFYKLHEQKDTVALENVVDAFSVEKLNKEFFNKYKEHYEDFVQFITGKRFKKVGGKWKEVEIHEPNAYLESVFENDNKQARDFVKKLLGRMVFLQFLQKKGWMGCSADSSEWKNGDYTFCKSLFESANQDQFHSNYLAHLFDALNTSNRENDVFDLAQTRVPYLNGGLFEADNDAIRKIDFPASHFESLLSFFGEYNFTIDENDPNDHEVGIDPEMLGHIFENLLEDNKDKGAFYTPKPIVQYMCQESLIQYLKTHLDNETNDIENFIRIFDKGDEQDPSNYILKNAKLIEELLDNVKICDPAIGSGAFPMGLLQIIFRAKMSLDWTLDPAEVKREIIQNSIYGVDIEKGAVDIARLRFWLSLIVDEKVPQPLPNLDYKIMQGNSLLESFEGVDLSQIGQGEDITSLEPEADLFGNIKEEQLSVTQTKSGLKQEIQNLIDAYFSLMGIEEKQKVKAKINNKIHEHIDFNLELQELQTQQFINQAGNPQYFTSKAKKKVDNWQNELDRLKSKRQNLHILQNEEEKPYFLWHLFFADVFEKGGFDIMIANPPYLKERDNATVFKIINESLYGDKYHQGKMDYWYYFLHRAIDCKNEKGIITFITPRYWIQSSGASKLINRIKDNLYFSSVLDIGKIKVFDNVVGQHIISLYNSTDVKKTIYRKVENTLKDIFSRTSTGNISISDIDSSKIIKNDEIRFSFSKVDLENNKTIALGDILECSQGVVEATDKISRKAYNLNPKKDISVGDGVFVVTQSEKVDKGFNEEECIKPYLDPNAVGRYYINPDDEFLIYSDIDEKTKIHNGKYPNIKSHLDKYSDFITSSNKPYGIHRARKQKYFDDPKLICKGMFSSPDFTYDDEKYYVGLSFTVMIQKDPHFLLKYVLAILNSKLSHYWFIYNGKRRGIGFDIGVKKFRKLPIVKADILNQHKCEDIVNKILTAKKANPEADTTTFETEINQLVYELYGLTDDEIRIIEDAI
jgi:adenine-specific DNA-methyltransferase